MVDAKERSLAPARHWAMGLTDDIERGGRTVAGARNRRARRVGLAPAEPAGHWPRGARRVTLRAASEPFGVPVAQWIERPPSKRRVVGSNPAGDANPRCERGTTRRLSRDVHYLACMEHHDLLHHICHECHDDLSPSSKQLLAHSELVSMIPRGLHFELSLGDREPGVEPERTAKMAWRRGPS